MIAVVVAVAVGIVPHVLDANPHHGAEMCAMGSNPMVVEYPGARNYAWNTMHADLGASAGLGGGDMKAAGCDDDGLDLAQAVQRPRRRTRR